MQKARAVRGQDLCCLMSKPADKREVVQLPAETPIAAPVNTRRAAAQRVREARDRLTSTSGTRPAFDAELLRQFAQNRQSGSLVLIMLICSIGLLSGVWTGALTAGTWTASVLLIHLIILFACKRFLAEQPTPPQIRAWR